MINGTLRIVLKFHEKLYTPLFLTEPLLFTFELRLKNIPVF